MYKLHGYNILIVAKSVTARTVWHYSTGNDESVCGKPAKANSVGYTNAETALKTKGGCLACCRYVAKHGDYQGWDDVNNVRFLSITNPKGEAHCAMHDTGISKCEELHGGNDGGFMETPVREYNLTVIRVHGDENIHATGCRDIQRSKARAGIWADDPWDMVVKDQQELAESVWGDVSTDMGPEGSPEWWEALRDNFSIMHWHNCARKLNVPRGVWQ